MFRIVVLISGAGSNLKAIHQAIQKKKMPVKIAAVFSNNPQAGGILFAKEADIPVEIIDMRLLEDKEHYDARLLEKMLGFAPDLIVLAGYMKILAPKFVRTFWGKIINIHPSLLPAYPGLHTHVRVLQAKEKYHGCSIHFVTQALDAGYLIAQSHLDVLEDDSPDSLQQRVHSLEHDLYPKIIHLFAQKRIKLIGSKVYYDEKIVNFTDLNKILQTFS